MNNIWIRKSFVVRTLKFDLFLQYSYIPQCMKLYQNASSSENIFSQSITTTTTTTKYFEYFPICNLVENMGSIQCVNLQLYFVSFFFYFLFNLIPYPSIFPPPIFFIYLLVNSFRNNFSFLKRTFFSYVLCIL